MESVLVHVFTADQVKTAAAESFMRRKGNAQSRDRRSLLQKGKSVLDLEQESLLSKIVSTPTTDYRNTTDEEDVLVGEIIDRTDLIKSEGEDAMARRTSLVKINLASCGNPPYNPGSVPSVFVSKP